MLAQTHTLLFHLHYYRCRRNVAIGRALALLGRLASRSSSRSSGIGEHCQDLHGAAGIAFTFGRKVRPYIMLALVRASTTVSVVHEASCS